MALDRGDANARLSFRSVGEAVVSASGRISCTRTQ